jgi:twinkle protein
VSGFWGGDDKPPARGLVNVEAVETWDAIWWTDPLDVPVLVDLGFRQTVALAGRLDDVLRDHADDLKSLKQIVLCLPKTEAGLNLREALAARLGRHLCHIVEWPDGCDDARQTILAHGVPRLEQVIQGASPYPISGLQRVKRFTLLTLRHTKPPETMTTGAGATDAILKLPTEGRLIVVTGIPAHGKTTWTRFAMVHTVTHEYRRWAIFSPEMQPWEQFAAECAEVFIGKPFWPKGGIEGMTDAEVLAAEAWIKDRVTMLVCDAEDEAPTLEWILERARTAVLRDGVTDLLIDPWNEIDQQRQRNETETDYIGRSLQRLKAFGLRHGCNIWVIAHPTKPTGLKTGEKRPPPGPYDISGAAHWANKADLGITIHSPDPGRTEVHLWKTRFRRFGKRGEVATLDFDEVTGRYMSPYHPPPGGLPSSWHEPAEPP